jgi:hypothetical protein
MAAECFACRAPLSERDRFCASCGSPVTSQASIMTGLAAATPHVAVGVGRLMSSDAVPVGGFTPGLVILDRYRIVGLLGRGGMGEVYRADDMKLGQAVALKFLPEDLSDDPVRRERFYAEVRIARQISHPNICRVYDIAEVDGRHFLSMEYVDGEDLASLLARIGHLHGAKAVDIARQLCAGLAAAHERGVLHRDLKPANVMLDGRGRVRITDFGLAIALDHAREERLISGTPAYMAPEQLAGETASVRSDIYALGLILYELYTGKRAFRAGSLAELRIQKEHDTPTAPSEISRDVDPIVERVIQRCIERDPRARPASVLAVAAALPGGDPLAAALAAGETPSPEMVAAAGSTEALRPAIAWALLAAFGAGLMAHVVLGDSVILHRRVPLDAAPAVMAERARAIVRAAGHVAPPADSAYGIVPNVDYVRHVMDNQLSHDDLASPEAVRFWYRQSLWPLERLGIGIGVKDNDPPLGRSGEIRIELNASGRLRDFTAVPPQIFPESDTATRGDWPALFRAAGLDHAAAQPVSPEWVPMFHGDERAAWTTDGVRVEAAAFAGRAVNFMVIAPWVRPARMAPPPRDRLEIASMVFFATLLALTLGGGAFFARRNLRLGRGDRRGATRLAGCACAALMASWLVGEDHVADAHGMYLFASWAGWALFLSSLLWVTYVAIEPYVRRNMPGLLVSWSRLLSGAATDPLVGRDVLIGCAGGAALLSLNYLRVQLPPWLGWPPEWPGLAPWVVFDTPGLLSAVPFAAVVALLQGLSTLFLLFLARLVLRRQALAVAAIVVVFTGIELLGAANPLLVFPFVLAMFGVMVGILAGVGLLAAIVMFVSNLLLFSAPSILPFGAWHSGLGATMVALVVALALYGFVRALGGRPAFGGLALDG